MADYTATAHVFPSANDVRGSLAAGWGKTMYEANVGPYLSATLHPNNFVLSGGLLPGTSASLSITVPACVALIQGHYVSVDAQAVTVGASVTSHCFLKILLDANNNVSSVAYETNTSGTAPSNSTKIGTIVSGVGTITSTTDARILGPGHAETLSSGTTWTFPAGITRVFVEVFGSGGGGGGGGEGAESGGPPGGSGTSGGNGGSTNFGAITATGGGGGNGGLGADNSGAGSAGPSPGSGSGGSIALTGGGLPGGLPGMGGGADTAGGNPGLPGIAGASGGYAAGLVTGAVGSTVSYAIGTAGTAGVGGSGNAGGNGGNGVAGQAGRIVIHYL